MVLTYASKLPSFCFATTHTTITLQHSGYAIQTLGVWGNGRVENIWRRVKYLSPTRLLSKTAYFMRHYACDNIENLILCKDVE